MQNRGYDFSFCIEGSPKAVEYYRSSHLLCLQFEFVQ